MMGRWISRALRPGDGPSSIARAIAEMKAEARAAGLTDAELTSKEQSGRGDHRMLPLDWIGIQEGTDKSSLIGDYLRHERIFVHLRD